MAVRASQVKELMDMKTDKIVVVGLKKSFMPSCLKIEGMTGEGIGHGHGASKSGTLKIGEGMELYGGDDEASAVRLSGPTESYTGSRPVYMEVRPGT